MNIWSNTLLASGANKAHSILSLSRKSHVIGSPEFEFQIRGTPMNLSELPEMVIVETRLITQKAASEAHIEMAATLENEIEVKHENEVIPTQMLPPQLPRIEFPPPLTTFMVPSKPKMIDANTATDSPLPMRERSMQTEELERTSVTVSTQCNLGEELEDLDDLFGPEEGNGTTDAKEAAAQATAVAAGKENVRFLEFAKAKTFAYANGKSECLLCGEIKANASSMRSHMALHWGPAALCFQCGTKFEHMSLLRAHNCWYKRKLSPSQTAASARRLFKCPHYRCSVVAISSLELYDHINEHAAEYLYRCTGCNRAFRTAGELRRHLPLRLQCLEHDKRQSLPYRRLNSKADAAYRVRTFTLHSKRRKFVLVKSFLSQRMLTRSRNSQRRCQICLQRCSNAFKFSNHTKRCLKALLYRLERKRNKTTMQSVPLEEPKVPDQASPLLNGYGH